jgi:hypothetical protein
MANKTKRAIAPFLASMMVGLLLVGFQNCTVATEFSSKNPVVEKGGDDTGGGAGGNGTGYEGKAFVNIDPLGLCPDKDKVRSRLKIKKNGDLVLVRANCKPVDPELKIPADAVIHKDLADGTGELLIFQNRIFVQELDSESKVPVPAGSKAIAAYCSLKSQDSLANSEVVVFQDPANLTSGGKGYSLRLVTSYLGNVASSDPAIPSVCLQNQSYVSPEFATNGQVSNMYISLYANSGPKFSVQVMTSSPGTGSLATNPGIPVAVNTNFMQALLLNDGTADMTNLCQNSYSNSNSGSMPTTLGQLRGTCYIADEPQPLQGF